MLTTHKWLLGVAALIFGADVLAATAALLSGNFDRVSIGAGLLLVKGIVGFSCVLLVRAWEVPA